MDKKIVVPCLVVGAMSVLAIETLDKLNPEKNHVEVALQPAKMPPYLPHNHSESQDTQPTFVIATPMDSTSSASVVVFPSLKLTYPEKS